MLCVSTNQPRLVAALLRFLSPVPHNTTCFVVLCLLSVPILDEKAQILGAIEMVNKADHPEVTVGSRQHLYYQGLYCILSCVSACLVLGYLLAGLVFVVLLLCHD